MNLYGSYRALLGNAISAMCAAIEVYNKPRFDYRDETAVILLVNAWEIVLKGVLSKNRVRIFYPKETGKPYRTLSLRDSLEAARPHFPASIDFDATSANLDLLIGYRDTAVHYYHKDGLEGVLYSLAQTAIVNFRDLVDSVFDRDLAEEVSLSLLPLSFSPPVEPVQFLKTAPTNDDLSAHVREFAEHVVRAVDNLSGADCDTARLLTIFKVSLVSTKRIDAADLIVGVQGEVPDQGKLLVHRPSDPNTTHPYRESDIITSKKDPTKPGLGIEYDGLPLGQFEFRAITYAYDAKSDPKWCWRDETGVLTRYSESYVNFLKGLGKRAVREAVAEYKGRTQ